MGAKNNYRVYLADTWNCPTEMACAIASNMTKSVDEIMKLQENTMMRDFFKDSHLTQNETVKFFYFYFNTLRGH